MLPQAKSHTPCFVLGAVRVAVEVAHARPLRVLEQLHEEERALLIFAAEAQVLVVAARLLPVEVDVEELARLERLRRRRARSRGRPSARARPRGSGRPSRDDRACR